MRRSHHNPGSRRRLTERCLAGFPLGEHDLTRCTDDPLAPDPHSPPQYGQTVSPWLHRSPIGYRQLGPGSVTQACNSLSLAMTRRRIAGNAYLRLT